MSTSKKIFCKELLYRIKLHDCGKLETERIPVAQPSKVKIIDFKADLKNILVDWLDCWDHGKADYSTDRPRPGRNRT